MVLKLLMGRVWQLGLLVTAVLVALAAGAGAAAADPTTPSPAPSQPPSDAGTMLENLLRGLTLPGVPTPGAPAGGTGQMIVVSVPQKAATVGTLTTFEKDAAGQWRPVLGPVEAYMGSLGIGEPQDDVHRTPEGTYALGQAFGRQDNPGTKMNYKKVDREDWWDGNQASPTYNQMVRRSDSPGPGSENLYDMGPAYDYAVEFKHNPSNTPGKATAMFLHVGSEPTWGCVAIDRESMIKVLKWLDPAKNPKISIGVNQSTPSDIKDAPSTTTPEGAPLPDDALTQLMQQLTAFIPQILGSVTGS
ncbi:MAG: hypothetical protein QM809_18510 [Gordonia sp. (in: high G+C Gram-positive bacteria)]|uniref:L,D-transpeptidase family protein n=1 Tax=Gordonia sp. (in: high G+C Gram-positive bacteria) TaxID=84139 RepID=UPI0039E27D87